MTDDLFHQQFATYITDVTRASDTDRAEQQLVGLFRTFVVQGFGVDSAG